jgi:hypothetical protein
LALSPQTAAHALEARLAVGAAGLFILTGGPDQPSAEALLRAVEPCRS